MPCYKFVRLDFLKMAIFSSGGGGVQRQNASRSLARVLSDGIPDYIKVQSRGKNESEERGFWLQFGIFRIFEQSTSKNRARATITYPKNFDFFPNLEGLPRFKFQVQYLILVSYHSRGICEIFENCCRYTHGFCYL